MFRISEHIGVVLTFFFLRDFMTDKTHLSWYDKGNECLPYDKKLHRLALQFIKYNTEHDKGLF